MISGILLSAGLSTRFGSPKALVDWYGQPVISHILRTLELSQVSEMIIVLGAQKDIIQPALLNHKGLKVVYNKDHNFGQTSSFQAGVRASSNQSKGFMLWPVDYPAIQSTTIQKLSDKFIKDHHRILIPTYQKQKGHPPILPATLKETILDLPKDMGINALISQHEKLIDYVSVDDPSIRQTFNTPEELDNIRS